MKTLKWLSIFGISVLGIAAILQCSISSGHVIKKQITYHKGGLQRAMIYDSLYYRLNTQVDLYLWPESDYCFYDLLD